MKTAGVEINSVAFVKLLTCQNLQFTCREESARRISVGDRLPLSARLRIRLSALLEQRGSAAWLSKYTRKSPFASRGISPTALSMFLHGTRRLHIDDLEGLAAGLNISIPELLGVPKWGDLTAHEQRVILAFRSLSSDAQAHFLGLIESLLQPTGDRAARPARAGFHQARHRKGSAT